MSKYSLINIIILAVVVLFFTTLPCEALVTQDYAQEIAVATGLPEMLAITDYDISLSPDFDSNMLRLRVMCTILNKGPKAIEQADFGIFAREKFYGVKVNITSVTQLISGKSIPQQFSHSGVPKPKEPSLEGSMEFPKITRVILSPRLEKGHESKLQFEYSFTEIDPHRRDLPYRILAALPNGSKEVCLLSDFTWIPRVSVDYEKLTELSRRNFFPKYTKPTWKISITIPSSYEAMVMDGRLEKKAGKEKVSQWTYRTPGLPQVFIGYSDRVEVKGEGASVVFMLPKGNYQQNVVEAVGNFMVRAYNFYSDLFGPLNGNEMHIAVSSADIGGHGAFLGMTLDASVFQQKMDESVLSPSRFFFDTGAHELAHSWWGYSLASYGRGTKFLRESLCNFSTGHLARKLFGIDRSAEYMALLFMKGSAKNRLFNPSSDSEGLAYQKGPFVLDILREEMGDDIFFKCLKIFATRFKGSHATFPDFVTVCNEVSQRDWMPFFFQWCYHEGYPIYRVMGFTSSAGKDGWETSVTIRNDGKGIVRCPLELRMGSEAQEEIFRVPEGEEITFTYRTPAQVDKVLIDPNHTAYQGDEKEARLKILAVKETNREWMNYWKGVVYGEIGENESAVEQISRAINSHTRAFGVGKAHPAFYFSRGIVYLHMGEQQKANEDLIAFIDRLLEMASENPNLTFGTLAYAELLSGSMQERQIQLNEILKCITGENIPFDAKFDGWRKWWRANKSRFQASPDASALSPRGIK